MNRILNYFFAGVAFGLGVTAMPLLAAVTLPHTFSSGETASATEVNENFNELVTAVEDLQTKVQQLEDGDIFALADLLTVYNAGSEPADTAVQGPIVRLTGANLQLINAAEDQTTPDGTGNLVVGFAEPRIIGDQVCSFGKHETQTDCESNGYTWDAAHNSGSHNIVGGQDPAYSQTGGFVVGRHNVVNRNEASVTGGRENIASGNQSTVAGGDSNIASGFEASVTGGEQNVADSSHASVDGGFSCELTQTNEWGAGSTGDCQ